MAIWASFRQPRKFDMTFDLGLYLFLNRYRFVT